MMLFGLSGAFRYFADKKVVIGARMGLGDMMSLVDVNITLLISALFVRLSW